MQYIMQARSSSDGKLYTWVSASADFAGAGWGARPGSPQEIAILVRPASSSPGGSGDVVGPGGAADNRVALFDGLTGKILKSSVVSIDGSGNIATSGLVDGVDVSVLPGAITGVLTSAQSYADTLFAGSEITPAVLAANQNNYAPTGWGPSTVVRLAASVPVNITGLGSSVAQRQKLIVNVGSQNITLKHQDAGSAASERILVSTGGDYVLAPNASIRAYRDNTTQRWRVTAGSGGGGGGETLSATLTLGADAGNQATTGWGDMTFGGEVGVWKGASPILTTSSGVTILGSSLGPVILAPGGTVDSLTVSDNGVASVLAGSAQRAGLVVTVNPPTNDHGRKVTVVASVANGTNKDGGIVEVRGTDPTGSGAAGGFDVHKTNASLLASFRNSLITFNAALMSGFSATFDSLLVSTGAEVRSALIVRGSGSGSTPVSPVGDIRLKNLATIHSVFSDGVTTMPLVSGTAFDGATFGHQSISNVTVDASSSVHVRVGGASRLQVAASAVQPLVPISFATSAAPYVSQIAAVGDASASLVHMRGQSPGTATNGSGGDAGIIGGPKDGTGLRGGAVLGQYGAGGIVERFLAYYESQTGHRMLMIGAHTVKPNSSTFPTPGDGVVAWKEMALGSVGVPPAGWSYEFYDAADHRKKSRDSTGAVQTY